jgi:hypothetical protein
MRIRLAVVAATALVTVAFGASAGVGAGANAAPSPNVIKLVSTTTSQRAIDKPPTGQSPGDGVFATSRLQNLVRQFGKAQGAVVGSDRGTTTLLQSGATRMDGIATLPGGTVHFHGIPKPVSGGSIIPVVGGTGIYDGATGTLTITDIDQLRAINVYRLKMGLVA